MYLPRTRTLTVQSLSAKNLNAYTSNSKSSFRTSSLEAYFNNAIPKHDITFLSDTLILEKLYEYAITR